MKKYYAMIAALIAFSTPVQAGFYSQAVEDERVCKEVGVTSAGYYEWKQKGITWEMAVEGTNPDPHGRDSAALMYIAAESAFSDKVHSAEDAYMRAWGKCMDRVTY